MGGIYLIIDDSRQSTKKKEFLTGIYEINEYQLLIYNGCYTDL